MFKISFLHAVGFANVSTTVVFTNSYDFDSDHHLVTADICIPCTKVARYVKQAALSMKNNVKGAL